MSEGRDAVGAGGGGVVGGAVRLRVPDRAQVAVAVSSPDELIGPGHRARVVWEVVCAMDLSDFSAPIRARDGVGGRDATDPRLLVSLWLYAPLRGVGSARELARLCAESKPYQWLCGGVGVNHHLLSDFRSEGGKKWDRLLTQIVAALMHEGLVEL
jgi:transposase